jgi:hypothetical protein
MLFSFNLLNLAMPLLSYAVCLVLLIIVLFSLLPCYLLKSIPATGLATGVTVTGISFCSWGWCWKV